MIEAMTECSELELYAGASLTGALQARIRRPDDGALAVACQQGTPKKSQFRESQETVEFQPWLSLMQCSSIPCGPQD